MRNILFSPRIRQHVTQKTCFFGSLRTENWLPRTRRSLTWACTDRMRASNSPGFGAGKTTFVLLDRHHAARR